LLERRADELGGLAGFDAVVINSVVQYFPDAAYLRRVLRGALGCLRPGGAIFVGDVRNHALLEAFHESVEREAGVQDGLQQRVRRRVESEQELLLDPAWFTRFAQECGREARVEAWLRRGRHHTELTRFRYDVLLTLDTGPAPPPERVLEWEPELDVAGALRAPGVLVRAIPSARLRDDGIDPEDLWSVPGVAVGWHGSGADARMDAASGVLPAPPSRDGALSNDPAGDEWRTGAELRRWLQERLPDAMVPGTVMVLDALPLTAHGKLDRAALPAPEAPARATAPSADASDAELRLAQVWAATLGVDAVGPDDNFFELGGDSILSIKLAARAADAGIFFSTKDLFERQTVRELAQVVSSTRKVEAEQGPIVGPVPLTPIQRWFFEQDLAEAHHFNQAASIAVPPAVDAELLVRALRAVVAHHDALQLRFDAGEARGVPFDGQLAVVSADMSAIAPAAVPGALDRVGGRLQASLALGGPLVRVGLVTHGPGRRRRLLIVIHHLAVDGVSWRILIEDLWNAYERLASGLPASLPPKTTSYRAWAQRLAEHAAELDEAAYWLGAPEAERLPRDLPGADNRVAVTRSVRVGLDEAETDALLRLPGSVHDALVYAAARAVARWTGWSAVPLAIEGHGREALFDDVDLSRTVGWFTSIYPLVVRPDDLEAVAAQLAAVPERGIGYGLLRYLSPDPELRRRLAARAWPEISFNYLGRLGDEAPDPLAERVGPVRGPAGERAHLIEINGAIAGGRLAFDVFYSTAFHTEATARALAEGFTEALREVLPRPGAGRVSERDLDTVLARVAERRP
jgi:non-ribosomal peptide synthase protein (TIGR01720 family)